MSASAVRWAIDAASRLEEAERLDPRGEHPALDGLDAVQDLDEDSPARLRTEAAFLADLARKTQADVAEALRIRSKLATAAKATPAPTAPVPREMLTREEAAASLGISVDSFERHVQPHVRVWSTSERGGLLRVPRAALEEWAARQGERLL